MWIFHQDNKPGKVWNPETNKVGVAFIDGLFESDDQSTFDLLKITGYRWELLPEEIEMEVLEPIPNEQKVRRKAR